MPHRVVSWISENLFGRFSCTVRDGLIQGMKRKGGLGWAPQSFCRRFESKEEVFWRGLDWGGLVANTPVAVEGHLYCPPRQGR